MLKEKLKNLKTCVDDRLSIFFPAVRGAVLLIVIPALVIVPIYFFSIILENISGKVQRPILEYEARLASLKKDLPLNSVVNYVSNSTAPYDIINTEYVLVPVRIIEGLEPMHDLLLFQNFDPTTRPEFKGYTLKKNYGNGVLLFQRNK